jgi:hypothetical protein
MSEQILLQGKILGTEEFLLAGSGEGRTSRSAGEEMLAGRSQLITSLCEVLPRALLAELGLARILLGSSGGGQFLVVLPGEARQAAESFLAAAANQVSGLSGGHVRLYLDRRGAAHEFCDPLAQAGDRIQDRAAAVRAYWRSFPEPVRQAFWPDLKALLLEKGLFNARDVEKMREEDAGPDRKPGGAPGAGPSGEGGGAG